MLKTGEGRPRKPFVVAGIPAYNEEKTIAKVVLKAQRFVDRVVVCDDGSSDLTGDIAERLGADVVRHERNLGKGAAFKSLFGRALELNADVVVTLDADGQHDPSEIPHLVKLILSGDADITVGSRFLTGNNDMPFYRRFGCRVLNGLVNSFAKKNKVSDTQSGFRAYNRKALKEIDIATKGIGVDSEILIKAYDNDVKIMEVPISCMFNGVEGSTYNPVSHGINVVGSIIKYASQRRPLLMFGLPGTMALAAGLMLFIYVLQTYFSTKQFAIGYLLTSMIGILIGVFAILTALILHAISNYAERVRK
jgi:glycosyltransferase involved in cell wall biosynthesis